MSERDIKNVRQGDRWSFFILSMLVGNLIGQCVAQIWRDGKQNVRIEALEHSTSAEQPK